MGTEKWTRLLCELLKTHLVVIKVSVSLLRVQSGPRENRSMKDSSTAEYTSGEHMFGRGSFLEGAQQVSRRWRGKIAFSCSVLYCFPDCE